MSEIWSQAASLLETASAVPGADRSDIAILVDDRNGIRIVDAAGWNLESLQREYRAASTYRVQRNAGTVVVEGQSGLDHCTLSKYVGANALTPFMSSIPHHLVCPERVLLS